jgi:hypothetical protein
MGSRLNILHLPDWEFQPERNVHFIDATPLTSLLRNLADEAPLSIQPRGVADGMLGKPAGPEAELMVMLADEHNAGSSGGLDGRDPLADIQRS